MISSELNTKISEVVESSITVDQFEEWLVPRLPFYISSPDSEDSDIIAEIELGLAEMSDNIRTRDEFLSLLRNILREQSVIIHSSLLSETTTNGSSNQTTQPITIDFTATSVPVLS